MCVCERECPPPAPGGVCRLPSSIMSETERHTDREEDYRFLHSMLMEKKLHLLFKVKILSSFLSVFICVGNNYAVFCSG